MAWRVPASYRASLSSMENQIDNTSQIFEADQQIAKLIALLVHNLYEEMPASESCNRASFHLR